MEYLVSVQEMKECDRTTIREFGMPSMVLMERAAYACVQVILEEEGRTEGKKESRRVLVVAGCGNNGGDGLAVGRMLMQKGFPVDFVLVGSREKCSAETTAQIGILENYGCRILERLPEKNYDIVVDALFGIGLHSKLEGIFAEAVEYMNQQDAFVLSVDIPSGIHGDTGAVCGCAVRADVTVTFAFRKMGLMRYPGASYAGRLLCRDIGITKESFRNGPPGAFFLTERPGELLPVRRPDGNKGTFGKILLAAGSRGMAGAAVLSAEAVLRTGAGMVRVFTEEENRMILQTALPEALVSTYGEGKEWGGQDAERLQAALSWADVIAAGPGMGTEAAALRILDTIIASSRKPLILDADAINLLAAERSLLKRLTRLQQDKRERRALILTPHPGEAARLIRKDTKWVVENAPELCREWADRLQAAFVCKGARSFIAGPDGRLCLNGSGNSGMATAGSGDVLTGMIAALAAQGMDAFRAACVGVYLHGCAGDGAARRKNEYSLTARDLTAELSRMIERPPSGRRECARNGPDCLTEVGC